MPAVIQMAAIIARSRATPKVAVALSLVVSFGIYLIVLRKRPEVGYNPRPVREKKQGVVQPR
jgi:hypothetical protein